jgi:hypothetical protein
VQCVEVLEAEGFNDLCSKDNGWHKRLGSTYPTRQEQQAPAPYLIYGVLKLVLKNVAADPENLPCPNPPKHQKHRLSFQSDSFLSLIVKRTIQATRVDVERRPIC